MNILSLFDYTATWPKPFFDRGWGGYALDLKTGTDIGNFQTANDFMVEFGNVHGILAAPPCTHFSVSGAQYWDQKDQDGRTDKALELVYQVARFANFFKPTDPTYYEETGEPFFWAFENPVGRLPKLIDGLGDPLYFDPWEYAGYLDHTDQQLAKMDRIRKKNGEGVTMEETFFVLDMNAYTKKTGLWGEFNKDIPKKPIEPVRCCPQGSPLQRLGGKSQRTKTIRSKTPAGFAEAFYLANKKYQAPLSADVLDPTFKLA